MRKCCKVFALLLFLLTNILTSKAQQEAFEKYQPGIKSPEASTLGQFGEIPVSLFNGLPDISVPLTEVKCGDISFPVNLQYYAGGNRPDQHPGWTGLGWTLNAGGVITRQVNGKRDEFLDPRFPNSDPSYIAVKGALTNPNWTTFANSIPPAGGVSYNSFAPDEFNFTVNGISGSIFLNYDGTWKVKSKQGVKIDIQVEAPAEFSFNANGYTQNVPRTFTKFTLTMGDGTSYIFGGQPNAIDFSYPALPGMGYFSTFEAYYDYYADFTPRYSIEANAWRLVQIISPKGHTVNFIYAAASTLTFNQTNYTNSYYVNGSSEIETYENNMTNKNMVTNFYLEKIIGDNNIEYAFNRSLSNELNWVWLRNHYTDNSFIMFGYDSPDFWRYYKLDNIKVTNAGSLIQDINFEYIENSNERLKLNRVMSKSNLDEVRNIYKFDYNPKMLPAYNSKSEDHWGFNNGKPNWPYGLNPTGGALYFQSREPDAAFMDAEVLQKITYPSGGFTQFEFEPHQYSSVVSQYPTIVCNSINQNKIAGGLRIKRIISNDNVDKTVTKEFFYTKDYISGGTLSSGVLSGIPKYYEEGSYTSQWGVHVTFRLLSSGALNYLNHTNGNHVTYSEVVEKNGEGFLVHKFQNHDNGFLDKPAFVTTFRSNDISPDLYINKTFGKLELERGLTSKQLYYSSGLQLLKEVINEYNDDPDRFNDHVRCLYDNTSYPGYIIGFRSAYPIYTFFPYLKKQIIKNYSQVGGGSPLVTINEYQYDPGNRNLKRETSINSTGEQIVTDYKYPSDLVAAGEDPNGIYNGMLSKHMLSYLVEKKTTRGGVQLSTNKINFYNPFTGIYVPGSVDVQQGNSPLEKRIQLLQYDAKGNLLELQKTDNVKEVYLWGYNGFYPVAKIIGANYGAVMNIVNQSILNNPANDNSLRSELEKLRINLPQAMVYTYTYSPLKGITSETNPQGRSIYYEYDGFNRLTTVRDQDNNIIKKMCYNYAGQPENCRAAVYNTEQWQVFTKNDCQSGYMGSQVKYTVQANTYYSYIDVNDANSKALNDIATKGQGYANDNGKCILICTTGNCSGPSRKCINNNCETGVKTLYTSTNIGVQWECVYYYRWSDGSTSNYFIEYSEMPCLPQ
jgi:YD repeat-containing protein